ncbi:hypothetical protein [Pasteurella atlantica]|uniref:hypothetical protein n=1 Tax=Pasteurellaceae TaxID=712 RepID=UPI00274EAA7A|nr:hypothetical protein [Pasteurella atlantica]MDP8100093.1 hypothetical protein [Pasteurella atlantica]MDP8108006.1 hypothetical protein [Pasteurella atlantica]MDP8117732.1 hypothetical protein [Pasteurella atlantica]
MILPWLIDENQQFKRKEKELLKTQNEQFVNDLTRQFKLIPALKKQALELLNYATDFDNGETLCFSEGESLEQKMKAFLNGQPTVIDNREICTYEFAKKIGIVTGTVSYNEQYPKGIPPEKIKLDKKIRAYMQQHNTDYQTAFKIITKKLEKESENEFI